MKTLDAKTTSNGWILKKWQVRYLGQGGIVLPDRLFSRFQKAGLSVYQFTQRDTFVVLRAGIRQGSFDCVDRGLEEARFESNDPAINKLLGNQEEKKSAAKAGLDPFIQKTLNTFLDARPEWREDRVLTAAVALFLLQDRTTNNRQVARIYLDCLFKVPVESFEVAA